MSQPPWAGFYRLTQLRRWQNAIPQRFSCRAFSAPADVSQLAALNYTAQRVCLPGVRIAISSQEAERMVVNVPLFPKFEGVAHYAVLMARSVNSSALPVCLMLWAFWKAFTALLVFTVYSLVGVPV